MTMSSGAESLTPKGLSLLAAPFEGFVVLLSLPPPLDAHALSRPAEEQPPGQAPQTA